MNFLKRHWSTLVLIVAVAAYLGLSMGTNQCPLCVVSNLVTDDGVRSTGESAQIMGEQDSSVWQVDCLDGKTLSSESSKGKVTVIVYWATWCAPCREEIPTLVALREEFSPDELTIVGVSLDQSSTSIDKFVTSNRINYDIARNNDSLEQAFGPIRYIPTTLVLDRNGKVQQRYTGLVASHVIRGKVETLLEQDA